MQVSACNPGRLSWPYVLALVLLVFGPIFDLEAQGHRVTGTQVVIESERHPAHRGRANVPRGHRDPRRCGGKAHQGRSYRRG